jgi:uncharacterized DUF497 family protein
MKLYNWNNDKNELLRKNRAICFEDIVLYIDKGFLIDDIVHPNQEKYPGQRMLVVDIENYIYLIPYVESKGELFMKTIIPSRKATKKYLEKKND